MFEGFNGNGSTQSSIIYYLDSNVTPGSAIKLTDESGNEIFSSADQTQSYNAVLYSSDKLESGKKYDISVGDSKESVTLESGSNTVGNRQGGIGQPPQGGNFGGPQGGGNGDRQGQPPQMNGNGREQGGMGQPPQGGQQGGNQGQPPQGGPQGGNRNQPPQGGQKQDQANINDNQDGKNKGDSKKKKNKQKNNKNTENKSGKEQ